MSKASKTDEAGPLIPLVAIVGRPNVGKSTVFNRLVGQRRSIVSDEAGVTRDRIYGTADWSGAVFEVVDTGGIVPGEESEIPRRIFEQASIAIDAASVILFVVDARAGCTPADEDLAALLRRTSVPILLLINKVDSIAHEAEAADFARLGFEKSFPISAEHGRGYTEFLDEAVRYLSRTEGEASPIEEVRVAIIGKPNSGKSTLLNFLTGEDRSMVSAEAGTTRDAVDSLVERGGRRFRFVDTAGIRHPARTSMKADRLSVMMARRHLELSDVALLVIDASVPVAAIDATIGGYAHESGRSVLIVVNKWDLVAKTPSITAEFETALRAKLKFLDYAPIVSVSAKTGLRVHKLYAKIAGIYENRRLRISTGQLNQFLSEVSLQRGGLPSDVEVRYICQVRTGPPTFVVFTKGVRRFHFSFERFLVNRLRDRFSFEGTPIIIKQRARKGNSRGKSRDPR